MQNKQFGNRIRELRQQARLSQRELAKKVGIDFTYLSKMENELLPPPSEKVIQRLAEALSINKDELLSLGGKIPSDITELLKNPEILERLRAEQTREEKPVSLNETKNQSPKTSIKPVGVIAAIILVAIVATLIWFAAPTKTTAIEANNRGVALNNEGEYLKAIEILNKAIEIDPNLALAYNNRGWSYLELGQYEQAISDCNKAIDLDPRLALAYSNRGLAYVKLSHYEQALADCNKAIDLNPNLALAYTNRGQAYIGLGKYDEAIADFDKALRLDPSLQKK